MSGAGQQEAHAVLIPTSGIVGRADVHLASHARPRIFAGHPL